MKRHITSTYGYNPFFGYHFFRVVLEREYSDGYRYISEQYFLRSGSYDDLLCSLNDFLSTEILTCLGCKRFDDCVDVYVLGSRCYGLTVDYYGCTPEAMYGFGDDDDEWSDD